MDALFGGLLLVLGFTILVPDVYWLWKCFRPDAHWLRKIRNNDYAAIGWSLVALAIGTWLLKVALFVGLNRGIAYSFFSICITLFFWTLFRFRSVKEFLRDKPWNSIEKPWKEK